MIKWTFEVAIYNNLKIKIIRHRVIGDGCICEGISPMNTCRVSQSVFYQVLNTGQWWWCLKKRGEVIFHLKKRLKR